MTAVSLRRKTLQPHKAHRDARFEMRNVLTNDPFTYVDLWLRRQHEDEALFYWRQAGSFYDSARNLPIEAKPLLLYYSFMNAAKALLAAKHIAFNPYHGVGKHNMRQPGGKVVLSNEGVRIYNKGVLASISAYYGETETNNIHSLEDILYNLVHVHRTYCLTYLRRRDIFLPIKEPQFNRDDATGATFFEATVGTDVDWEAYRKTLPASFQHYPRGIYRIIRSSASAVLSTAVDPPTADLDQLRILNRSIRSQVKYIRGSSTLWYLKMTSPTEIAREPVTLTLGAMHRLSELSRYHPSQLTSLLNGQRNWLLSEFITMSPSQYIDEIAAEMTGHQVLVPNVRMPV